MGFLLERARNARGSNGGRARRDARRLVSTNRKPTPAQKRAGGWVGGYSDDPDSCHRTQRGFCHINITGAPARAVERARRDWTTHALFPNAENTRVSMSAVASTLNARVVARTRAPRARIASLSARTLVPHAVPARSVQSSSARARPRAARAALESNPGESFDAARTASP